MSYALQWTTGAFELGMDSAAPGQVGRAHWAHVKILGHSAGLENIHISPPALPTLPMVLGLGTPKAMPTTISLL